MNHSWWSPSLSLCSSLLLAYLSFCLSLSLSPFICVSPFLPLLFPLPSMFSLCLIPSLPFFLNILPLSLPHPSLLFRVYSSQSHPLALCLQCLLALFFFLSCSLCLKTQDINEKIRAEHVNIGNSFLDGPRSWFSFPSKSCELANSLRISQTVRALDVKKHLTITESKCWAISWAHTPQGGTCSIRFSIPCEKTSQKRGVKKNKVKVKPLTHLFPPSPPPPSHWLLYCVSEVLPLA